MGAPPSRRLAGRHPGALDFGGKMPPSQPAGCRRSDAHASGIETTQRFVSLSMKRVSLSIAILLLTTPLWALKGTPEGKRPLRIAVLHTSDRWGDPSMDAAAAAIEHEIVGQLRQRGAEAWEVRHTLEDVQSEASFPEADLLVEVTAGEARQHEIGGVALGDTHVSTTLGLVLSRVAAEVRLYDARSHELLDRYELSRSKKAVLPTSLGMGDSHFFVYSVVPIARHFQYRSAVRDVASEAADRITAGR
jgi:hypothetical protein